MASHPASPSATSKSNSSTIVGHPPSTASCKDCYCCWASSGLSTLQLSGVTELSRSTFILPTGGCAFGSAVLLWPDSERFADEGEINVMEVLSATGRTSSCTSAPPRWRQGVRLVRPRTPSAVAHFRGRLAARPSRLLRRRRGARPGDRPQHHPEEAHAPVHTVRPGCWAPSRVTTTDRVWRHRR